MPLFPHHPARFVTASIASLPLHAIVLRIEVAGQNLSTPGESVSSAHFLSIVAPTWLTLRASKCPVAA